MKRRLLVISGAVTGALGVAILVFVISFPRIGNWMVRTRVLPRVEKMLGRKLVVGAIKVSFGRVVLEGVEIAGPRDPEGTPLLQVARITVDYDFWSALDGSPELGVMVVDRPRVALTRDAEGLDNYSDILDRLRRRREGEREGGGGGRLRPREVVVEHGAVALEDRLHGVKVSVEEIAGSARPRGPARLVLTRVEGRTDFGPAATADKLVVEANLADPRHTGRVEVEGGSATLWPKMSLTGIGGVIAPGDDDGVLQVALRGGWGGVEGTLWHAEGWVDPARRAADVHLKADRFTLDKVQRILAGTPVEDPERTSIDATLDIEIADGSVNFEGALHVAGLTLYHPMLAEEPVRDLGFAATVRGRYVQRARLFDLDSAGIEVKGMKVLVEGYAAFPGGHDDGGVLRTEPRLRARIVIPDVRCQDALAAMPPELTPTLQGFKLGGVFATDLTVDIDWANLDALELGGSVGIARCKALKAPKGVDTARLIGEFEHFVEVERDRWVSFLVGPSNPDYVPLYDVSPYLVKSFLTTEDGGFYRHRGYIVREFRSALIRNLKEGYFKYGASSITMQFVKNVLLYRQKTLSRKLQELFLTWYVEQTLDKDRILEIYVNVIEFGPGIYGIGAAARHYFGKHPRDLNPVEAAFFSSILPNPKGRYMQFCEGKLSRWGDAKVGRIIKVMWERGHITDEEYTVATQTPLVFDRTEALGESECKAMTRRMIERARPTTPKRLAN